jgi:hypothetical protein
LVDWLNVNVSQWESFDEQNMFKSVIFTGLIVVVGGGAQSPPPERSPHYLSPNGLHYENVSVAVCIAGQDRSMMHPAVIAAYVEAFAHIAVLQTFAVISIDASTDPTLGPSHSSSSDPYLQGYGAISDPGLYAEYYKLNLQVYGLSVSAGTLQFANNSETFVSELYSDRGSCGNRSSGNRTCCRPRHEAQRLAASRDTNWNEAEQMWKVSLCYRMVMAWESRNSDVAPFQWLVRWRPDIIPLSRFVAFSLLHKTKAHVNYDTQDHFFVCFRGETCEKYFVGIMEQYLKCKDLIDKHNGRHNGFHHHIELAGFAENSNNLAFIGPRRGPLFSYRLFRRSKFLEECKRRRLFGRRLADGRFRFCEVYAAVREYTKLLNTANQSQGGGNQLLHQLLCDGGSTGISCGNAFNGAHPTSNERPGLEPGALQPTSSPPRSHSEPLAKLVLEIRSIVGCGHRACKKPPNANPQLDLLLTSDSR